jgi:hypothetical protein
MGSAVRAGAHTSFEARAPSLWRSSRAVASRGSRSDGARGELPDVVPCGRLAGVDADDRLQAEAAPRQRPHLTATRVSGRMELNSVAAVAAAGGLLPNAIEHPRVLGG